MAVAPTAGANGDRKREMRRRTAMGKPKTSFHLYDLPTGRLRRNRGLLCYAPSAIAHGLASRRTQNCFITCIRPLKHPARLLAIGAVFVKCQ